MTITFIQLLRKLCDILIVILNETGLSDYISLIQVHIEKLQDSYEFNQCYDSSRLQIIGESSLNCGHGAQCSSEVCEYGSISGIFPPFEESDDMETAGSPLQFFSRKIEEDSNYNESAVRITIRNDVLRNVKLEPDELWTIFAEPKIDSSLSY